MDQPPHKPAATFHRACRLFCRNAGGAPNVTRRERPDCPLSFWYEPTITLCMIRPYYFNLAMENSVALDYVTEKLYDPLLVGVVPVYKGAPNVENFVPPHTIIKFDDFEVVAAGVAWAYGS